mmetsp:Transcript_116375/g.183102  ORF Transcript_116375/g.183102 Transcript_116375/m.183102 type:complete len:210 (-) Transcript_116375:213-842(-)
MCIRRMGGRLSRNTVQLVSDLQMLLEEHPTIPAQDTDAHTEALARPTLHPGIRRLLRYRMPSCLNCPLRGRDSYHVRAINLQPPHDRAMQQHEVVSTHLQMSVQQHLPSTSRAVCTHPLSHLLRPSAMMYSPRNMVDSRLQVSNRIVSSAGFGRFAETHFRRLRVKPSDPLNLDVLGPLPRATTSPLSSPCHVELPKLTGFALDCLQRN